MASSQLSGIALQKKQVVRRGRIAHWAGGQALRGRVPFGILSCWRSRFFNTAMAANGFGNPELFNRIFEYSDELIAVRFGHELR